jgi:hypothetical protein
MTRPVTSSRVMLIADRRQPTAELAGTPIRRYRLARLRIESREADPGARFEHLKRTFD